MAARRHLPFEFLNIGATDRKSSAAPTQRSQLSDFLGTEIKDVKKKLRERSHDDSLKRLLNQMEIGEVSYQKNKQTIRNNSITRAVISPFREQLAEGMGEDNVLDLLSAPIDSGTILQFYKNSRSRRQSMNEITNPEDEAKNKPKEINERNLSFKAAKMRIYKSKAAMLLAEKLKSMLAEHFRIFVLRCEFMFNMQNREFKSVLTSRETTRRNYHEAKDPTSVRSEMLQKLQAVRQDLNINIPGQKKLQFKDPENTRSYNVPPLNLSQGTNYAAVSSNKNKLDYSSIPINADRNSSWNKNGNKNTILKPSNYLIDKNRLHISERGFSVQDNFGFEEKVSEYMNYSPDHASIRMNQEEPIKKANYAISHPEEENMNAYRDNYFENGRDIRPETNLYKQEVKKTFLKDFGETQGGNERIKTEGEKEFKTTCHFPTSNQISFANTPQDTSFSSLRKDSFEKRVNITSGPITAFQTSFLSNVRSLGQELTSQDQTHKKNESKIQSRIGALTQKLQATPILPYNDLNKDYSNLRPTTLNFNALQGMLSGLDRGSEIKLPSHQEDNMSQLIKEISSKKLPSEMQNRIVIRKSDLEPILKGTLPVLDGNRDFNRIIKLQNALLQRTYQVKKFERFLNRANGTYTAFMKIRNHTYKIYNSMKDMFSKSDDSTTMKTVHLPSFSDISLAPHGLQLGLDKISETDSAEISTRTKNFQLTNRSGEQSQNHQVYNAHKKLASVLQIEKTYSHLIRQIYRSFFENLLDYENYSPSTLQDNQGTERSNLSIINMNVTSKPRRDEHFIKLEGNETRYESFGDNSQREPGSALRMRETGSKSRDEKSSTSDSHWRTEREFGSAMRATQIEEAMDKVTVDSNPPSQLDLNTRRTIEKGRKVNIPQDVEEQDYEDNSGFITGTREGGEISMNRQNVFETKRNYGFRRSSGESQEEINIAALERRLERSLDNKIDSKVQQTLEQKFNERLEKELRRLLSQGFGNIRILNNEFSVDRNAHIDGTDTEIHEDLFGVSMKRSTGSRNRLRSEERSPIRKDSSTQDQDQLPIMVEQQNQNLSFAMTLIDKSGVTGEVIDGTFRERSPSSQKDTSNFFNYESPIKREKSIENRFAFNSEGKKLDDLLSLSSVNQQNQLYSPQVLRGGTMKGAFTTPNSSLTSPIRDFYVNKSFDFEIDKTLNEHLTKSMIENKAKLFGLAFEEGAHQISKKIDCFYTLDKIVRKKINDCLWEGFKAMKQKASIKEFEYTYESKAHRFRENNKALQNIFLDPELVNTSMQGHFEKELPDSTKVSYQYDNSHLILTPQFSTPIIFNQQKNDEKQTDLISNQFHSSQNPSSSIQIVVTKELEKLNNQEIANNDQTKLPDTQRITSQAFSGQATDYLETLSPERSGSFDVRNHSQDQVQFGIRKEQEEFTITNPQIQYQTESSYYQLSPSTQGIRKETEFNNLSPQIYSSNSQQNSPQKQDNGISTSPIQENQSFDSNYLNKKIDKQKYTTEISHEKVSSFNTPQFTTPSFNQEENPSQIYNTNNNRNPLKSSIIVMSKKENIESEGSRSPSKIGEIQEFSVQRNSSEERNKSSPERREEFERNELLSEDKFNSGNFAFERNILEDKKKSSGIVQMKSSMELQRFAQSSPVIEVQSVNNQYPQMTNDSQEIIDIQHSSTIIVDNQEKIEVRRTAPQNLNQTYQSPEKHQHSTSALINTDNDVVLSQSPERYSNALNEDNEFKTNRTELVINKVLASPGELAAKGLLMGKVLKKLYIDKVKYTFYKIRLHYLSFKYVPQDKTKTLNYLLFAKKVEKLYMTRIRGGFTQLCFLSKKGPKYKSLFIQKVLQKCELRIKKLYLLKLKEHILRHSFNKQSLSALFSMLNQKKLRVTSEAFNSIANYGLIRKDYMLNLTLMSIKITEKRKNQMRRAFEEIKRISYQKSTHDLQRKALLRLILKEKGFFPSFTLKQAFLKWNTTTTNASLSLQCESSRIEKEKMSKSYLFTCLKNVFHTKYQIRTYICFEKLKKHSKYIQGAQVLYAAICKRMESRLRLGYLHIATQNEKSNIFQGENLKKLQNFNQVVKSKLAESFSKILEHQVTPKTQKDKKFAKSTSLTNPASSPSNLGKKNTKKPNLVISTGANSPISGDLYSNKNNVGSTPKSTS